MENHGLIACGRTVREVEASILMFVKASRILLGTYALGGPRFLQADEVARIDSRPDEKYRRSKSG
jgi:ribulose-5-phosphate 4-epimerase/fuculose-1-phosphate aldolase